VKTISDFMKAIRQGTLAEEARERVNSKMKSEDKVKNLFQLARENNYDINLHELEEDLKKADARAFEEEVQTAARLGIEVQHNVRDYGWPFS